MSRRVAALSSLLSDRILLIRWGQSNIASRYDPATDWGVVQQGQQDAAHCYRTYSHGDPAVWSERATWERIAPHPVGTPESGIARGHWGLDLATGLGALGLRVAILDYCVGGTSLAYWVPDGTYSSYDTALAWTQARIAELDSPGHVLFLFDQGESGLGTGGTTWAADFALVAAGLRADLGVPNMGIVIQQVPENSSAYDAGVAASKVTYVAGDARCRMAYVKQQTFTSIGPANLHINAAGGRLLAIGPDSSNCVSYLTGIKSLLGIT